MKMTSENDEKDKIIKELEEEDKRLNQVIINLHDDIRRYKQKIKVQGYIIGTQQDIISAFCELVGMVNDKEGWDDDDGL